MTTTAPITTPRKTKVAQGDSYDFTAKYHVLVVLFYNQLRFLIVWKHFVNFFTTLLLFFTLFVYVPTLVICKLQLSAEKNNCQLYSN